jgi:hypothetical protein
VLDASLPNLSVLDFLEVLIENSRGIGPEASFGGVSSIMCTSAVVNEIGLAAFIHIFSSTDAAAKWLQRPNLEFQ